MADHAQVVRDEHVGQMHLVLELVEQVDDLRLDRDVERGDRLVEHDQLRVDRQRAGDPDPLALAAGELVREAVDVLGVQPDALEQLRVSASIWSSCDAPDAQRRRQDLGDPLAWVQRGLRVLEDHLHLAPDRLELLAGPRW